MARFTVTNTNDSGAGSLRQAVTNANALSGKDIINFCGVFNDGLAHTISLTGGGLSITDDITIKGRNPNLLTISENSASRVFDITSGATAKINGLTITNSYNNYDSIAASFLAHGGGIAGGGGISNEGVLTLNNSVITGNTLGSNFYNTNEIHPISVGAGIFNTGTLIVNDSIISDNTATTFSYVAFGGRGNANGYSIQGYGSGIYNTGNLTLNNSNITGNSIAKSISYTNSSGGAGYSESISFKGEDGVYNIGNLTVNHSTFNGNNNGAIGNTGNLIVNDTTITENTADINGGGIYNAGKLTVNSSNISSNTANSDGGGIYNTGKLTVNSSNISDNTVKFEGGGIFNNYGATLTVNYSSINGNTADKAGGGIYNDTYYISPTYVIKGVVTVSESTIKDNQAHFGAGIYNGGILVVDNSAIEYNKAFGIELSSSVYQSGDGGGIYNNSNYATTTVYSNAIGCNFDTSLEGSNNFISPDDIAGKFIDNGYNWIGINTATTAAGDAA